MPRFYMFSVHPKIKRFSIVYIFGKKIKCAKQSILAEKNPRTTEKTRDAFMRTNGILCTFKFFPNILTIEN